MEIHGIDSWLELLTVRQVTSPMVEEGKDVHLLHNYPLLDPSENITVITSSEEPNLFQVRLKNIYKVTLSLDAVN